MIRNDEIFIVVSSISNTVNAISELDDLIIKETSGSRVTELRKRQRQLIEVLKKLVQELNSHRQVITH